ncbi:MAG: TrkH family potassium uptake protein [Polyangiaceae bacterium]|nr:TrkH family potassium uptake protein [Polyangiaceae bacterium]
MRLLLVVSVIGQLVRLFSWAFLPPGLLALLDQNREEIAFFFVPLFLSQAFGALASRVPTPNGAIERSEALAVVAGTWLAVAIVGALPYAFSGLPLVDALFESISGFTTTGATILSDFTTHGRAFFLWRAMTQWFGGLGVIALFVVILPRLGIAGRQLFFAEASRAPAEAVSPSAQLSAQRLWILYSILTLLLAALLWWAGLNPYESIVHALTTLSAGGFSPDPESIAGLENHRVEWILCAFMLLSGTSFTLQYKVFTGRILGFFKDGEFLLYLTVIIICTLLVSLALADGLPSLEHLRLGLFQITSLVSSTGFASTDYNIWNDKARGILIVAMVIGGCAASACGGPKVIRWLLMFKHVNRELRRVLHPRAVLTIRYKNAPVSDDIMRSVFMLVVLFLVGHFLVGVMLVFLGHDLIEGFSAALACLGNIGPAFGAAGPMGSFADFPTASKVILILAMWIGRLEVITVLALLHPDVLRRLRLSNRH